MEWEEMRDGHEDEFTASGMTGAPLYLPTTTTLSDTRNFIFSSSDWKNMREALSYAWGSNDDAVEIREQPNGLLPITRNLSFAMRHLRYLDRSPTLWIDAICINQQTLTKGARKFLQ
ncbi:HET-domain-containing protein [Venturia nashicola]|uniref:HET-domain-containing protein n=1 Tax=Venturia nashicola TaxID=86259 RepID=A0A4Z1NYQ6_9PEZI|nr:HET-domain-containing protein [Venturia nashicola]